MIVWAVMLVALCGMAALVLDLGQLRESVRKDQSVADFAALAGGSALSQGDYRTACKDAIEYIAKNVGLPEDSFTGSNDCSSMPASTDDCVNNYLVTPSTVVETSDKFTVTITSPVLNVAGSYPAIGAGAHDGQPCDRMQVRVTASEPSFFGSAAGYLGGNGTRVAVVRKTAGGSIVPSLWILDPNECGPGNNGGALGINGSAGSGAYVQVGTSTDPWPGVIAIDSDGSKCPSGASAVVLSVSQGSQVSATGEIDILAPGAPTCSGHACNNLPGISPAPTQMLSYETYAPVLWRYNCESDYSGVPYVANGLTIPLAPCTQNVAPGNTGSIDELRTQIGTSGPPTPTGAWTEEPLSACSKTGSTPVTLNLPPGNYWFPCAISLQTGDSINIQGNVVVDGGISLSGNASFTMSGNLTPGAAMPAACPDPDPNGTTPNARVSDWPTCVVSSSANAAYLFVRSGDISADTSTTLDLNKVFVYEGAGRVNLTAAPNWSAPSEGPFSDLSLWTETPSGTGQHVYALSGANNSVLSGIFFAPYASPFTIKGTSHWNQVSTAQFIVEDLNVTGNGTVTMTPSNNFIPLPGSRGLLIR